MQSIINNYDLRKPNAKGQRSKYLILIHYPNGKHYLFIANETERQLLNRVKAIIKDNSDKISYLNVYIINNDDRLTHYGEYRKELKNND